MLVNNVLITCFGNFSSTLFLSESTSLGAEGDSNRILPKPSFSSNVMTLFAFAPPASVPFNERLLITFFLFCGGSRTKSAVKFWPVSASTITIERTFSNANVLSAFAPSAATIVRLVLSESSTI